MSRAAGALLGTLLAATAWAAFAPPDTAGCREKFDKVACLTDTGLKGTCHSRPVNTPDFSVPGPPKFKVLPTMVCVATETKYSIKDVLGALLAGAVVFALFIYNMFRRRTLADHL
ncbi:MAG: hypothetical protein H6Q89_1778 [Myxococcaceae bacterium]|nr:hypothetical protein [Myxococcaceae bacterium]